MALRPLLAREQSPHERRCGARALDPRRHHGGLGGNNNNPAEQSWRGSAGQRELPACNRLNDRLPRDVRVDPGDPEHPEDADSGKSGLRGVRGFADMSRLLRPAGRGLSSCGCQWVTRCQLKIPKVVSVDA